MRIAYDLQSDRVFILDIEPRYATESTIHARCHALATPLIFAPKLRTLTWVLRHEHVNCVYSRQGNPNTCMGINVEIRVTVAVEN